MTWKDVLDFWFGELRPEQWWTKDLALDRLIGARFGSLLERAARAELWEWRESAQGRLAEVLVLDQFSRHVWRDSPRAFAQDPLALALAQEALHQGADARLDAQQRSFLYLPFMHSESRLIHAEAERLYRANGLEEGLRFELLHRAIIDRFGRYPHRNAILGRETTAEEAEFLTQENSSF